jgi:hypothetical protein
MSLLQNGPWDKTFLGLNIPSGQTVHPRFFFDKRTKCPRNFRDVLSVFTKHCTFLKNKIFLTIITYTRKSAPYFFSLNGPNFFDFLWSRIAIGKRPDPEPDHFSRSRVRAGAPSVGCAVHVRLKRSDAKIKQIFFRFEEKKSVFSLVSLRSETL